MSQLENAIGQRALELRRDFDRGFATAPAGEKNPSEAFLAIGVGGDGYAFRLAEISGLHADRKITPLPGAASDLLGLAGFRGTLVPVYDLRALLGYSAGPPPRWLVLVAPKTPVGLAFDRFDGHLRLPREAIAHEDVKRQERRHIAETLHADGQVRPIVNVGSIVDAITNRVSHSPLQKE